MPVAWQMASIQAGAVVLLSESREFSFENARRAS